jgi:cytochrome c biogenesis protein CcmG/thiol:disulfide interchange protein DsbE
MTPTPTVTRPRVRMLVVAAVSVACAVALAACGSSSGSSGTSTSTGGKGGDHEYGTVTVTGKALPRYTDGVDDPAKGEAIPTVKGENFAGDPTVISPTTGKAQMVVFLAHWCPHCNREAPRLAAYLKGNGGKPPANVDLTIVPTGSSDQAPNWPPSQWVVQMGLSSLNTLVDDKAQTAAAAFGLSAYPFIVMVDASGKVVERRAGEQQDGFFDKAFTALSQGTPIPSNA